MLQTRVIPSLLLERGRLVKTVQFRSPAYVGDPINAVRIFNDKQVDELLFLDIGATPAGRGPDFHLLADIASEAFMPFAYGGGITRIEEIRRLYGLGVEKVVLNTAAAESPDLISQAAALAGSSGVVVSIDARRDRRGQYATYTHAGTRDAKRSPADCAVEAERRGAGEILLTSIERDGALTGYDLELIRTVSAAVGIPVVAAGGAGRLEHFREAVDSGAAAVSAGSLFVFHGRHRAVLITYPDHAELQGLFAR